LASAADDNAQWRALAPHFIGAFQVPTLRNVAARPAGFSRRYMHNGFFRNLDEVVHFLNTRDVLPVCADGRGVGVSCWPSPEIAANEEKTLTGNLGLTAHEEQALVAFLMALTDTAAP
jgi:cytochrome c peroxidase